MPHEPRVTRDYSPHMLCGGRTQSTVNQGPAPQSRDGLINATPKAREGRYISRSIDPAARSWAAALAGTGLRSKHRSVRFWE